jgi:hypothetical protein
LSYLLGKGCIIEPALERRHRLDDRRQGKYHLSVLFDTAARNPGRFLVVTVILLKQRYQPVSIRNDNQWCILDENLMIVDDPQSVRAYLEEFQRVYAQAQAPTVAAKSFATTRGILFDGTSLH